MVFSKVEEGSEGNGHKGEVTRSDLSVMGTNTDVDNIRGDTGDTLGKTGTLGKAETGTQDETEDATSCGPNRMLTRCEDKTST